MRERFYEIGSPQGLRDTEDFLTPRDRADAMNYTQQHLLRQRRSQMLDIGAIERIVTLLAQIKARAGRIFFLGVGGGAANCSHAVNDFRKLAGIEMLSRPRIMSRNSPPASTTRAGKAHSPNGSRSAGLSAQDAIFIFSVGGGSVEKNLSCNLVAAVDHARSIGAKVIGIVGRDGGYTAAIADAA